MKKRKTRLTALFLAALLSATVFSGCTGSNDNSSTSGSSSSEGSSATSSVTSGGEDEGTDVEPGAVTLPLTDETVTVTMWTPMDSNLTTIVDSYSETAFFQRLEEETNVHIEFDIPATGNEVTAFNLMIASNELPDMIRYSGGVEYPGGLDAAIDDGYFMDLTELVPQYAPNYQAVLESQDEFNLNIRRSAVTSKGRIPGIYQLMIRPQGPWCGLYVRQDWLDELNMEVPETYDDWETMLTAFKDEMGATAPLMLYKTGYDGTTNTLNAGFGISYTFYQEDGTVKFGPAEEGWRDYITTMHDWYEKGLIDPDFMSSTAATSFLPDNAMVTTGKTGAFVGMYTNVSMWENSNTDPDALYTPVYPPMQKSGTTHDFQNIPLAGGCMVISAKSENSEICLRLLDYFFTEEGFLDLNYGVEGETYEIVDGQPKYNEFITNNDELSFGQAMAYYTMPAAWPVWQDWTRETGAVPEKDLVSYDIWGAGTSDKSMPSIANLGMDADDNIEYSRIMADIQSIVDEKTAQFISGAASLDEYDAYLEQLDQMGIQEATALVQKAYDAFLARDAG